MRKALLVGLLIACAGDAAAAEGDATVIFLHPERFTDASLSPSRPADAGSPALLGIRQHIRRLSRRLPADQTLEVEIVDVDLAGLFEPWRILSPNLRTLSPTAWPRIRLRFALHDQAGRTILQGEDDVADMAYLQRGNALRSLGPARFEEPMLTDWFDRRFPRR